MARIRTIKPEFCTSEQLVECSTSARLLFVTMWMFCDDGGNHPASTRRVKMECFPGDDFTIEEMEGFISELVGVGLLLEYEVEGESYWHVTGWKKHQKIDKPTEKYPPPPPNACSEKRPKKPQTPGGLDEGSTSTPRAVDEGSPPEGKGKEGKGKEGKGPSSVHLAEDSASPPTANSVSWSKEEGWVGISDEQVGKWKEAYPACDIRMQLAQMNEWLVSNPEKAVKSRWTRFISNWLKRHQDRGGDLKSNNGRSGAEYAKKWKQRVAEKQTGYQRGSGEFMP